MKKTISREIRTDQAEEVSIFEKEFFREA